MNNQNLVPSFNSDQITRFEVIDKDAGRLVVRYQVKVEVSVQDGGKTLKIFLEDNSISEEIK